MIVCALAAGLLLTSVEDAPATAPRVAPSEGSRVLVIMNSLDPSSVRLGRYYGQKRQVPKENLVLLSVDPTEEVSQSSFSTSIEAPVRQALARSKNEIDFLLLVRGVPIRVREGGYSVDSLLMSHGLKTEKLTVGGSTMDVAPNPYFRRNEPFRHKATGFYLACRLDGYTEANARSLVDNSLAAKPHKGPFLLDEATNRTGSSFGQVQATLGRAATLLEGRGFEAVLDRQSTFAGSTVPVAGYVTWGSNDGAYKPDVYRSIRFKPGAICETFVSTSGRTFRPTTGGQSLIADLIAQGVTGVKGYVSEPYTLALANADILFDRYTAGRNLAESFYAASPVAHWKDVVIGDPLCAPYRK